jgi:hypothetical protein
MAELVAYFINNNLLENRLMKVSSRSRKDCLPGDEMSESLSKKEELFRSM